MLFSMAEWGKSSFLHRLLLVIAAQLCLPSCVFHRLQPVPVDLPAVTSTAFAATASQLARETWRENNQVTTLANGGHFFPAMLKAMKDAKHSITWENFVAVESQPVADFTQVLCERAAAGVKVHVILDHYGCCTFGDRYLDAMKKAGVELHWYSPWRLHHPLGYNHRTHRRLLIIDGKTAFIGGAGLAYAWDGHAEDPSRWRDTMYQLEGPVVADLQRTFNDNWHEVTRTTLEGQAYFPKLSAAGHSRVLNIPGSNQDGAETIGSLFRFAIRSARSSIVISHAYFIPTRAIEKALLDALARGVRVEILVPGKHTDMPLCPCVTAPVLRRLLKAGAQLHRFDACMMHGKLVVIDDQLSIIGSGNIDPRSFFINDENNVFVLCASFAQEQLKMHAKDLERSSPIDPTALKQRPLEWLKGALGRLVKHQL